MARRATEATFGHPQLVPFACLHHCSLGGTFCRPSASGSPHPRATYIPSLPTRKNLGSDLLERPACASQGRFLGVAPAPLLFRPSCADRPTQIRNSLLNKALARPRVFRGGAKRASGVHGECFVAAFSPKQRTTVPRSASTTALFRGKGHGEVPAEPTPVLAFNHTLVRDRAVDPRAQCSSTGFDPENRGLQLTHTIRPSSETLSAQSLHRDLASIEQVRSRIGRLDLVLGKSRQLHSARTVRAGSFV